LRKHITYKDESGRHLNTSLFKDIINQDVILFLLKSLQDIKLTEIKVKVKEDPEESFFDEVILKNVAVSLYDITPEKIELKNETDVKLYPKDVEAKSSSLIKLMVKDIKAKDSNFQFELVREERWIANFDSKGKISIDLHTHDYFLKGTAAMKVDSINLEIDILLTAKDDEFMIKTLKVKVKLVNLDITIKNASEYKFLVPLFLLPDFWFRMTLKMMTTLFRNSIEQRIEELIVQKIMDKTESVARTINSAV